MEDERQPFLGPRPFERQHHDRFFGRKRELADLISLVIAHPIVFLYGQSGTGKTSLLNAGLIPKLADEDDFDVFPVARPGGKADLSVATAAQDSPYVFATLMAWAGAGAAADDLASMSLAAYLAARPAKIDDEGDPRPRLLIFDQLEELFRDQIDAEREQHTFFRQVADVLDAAQGRISEANGAALDPVPVRILFSMREEFIAELDAVSGLFPNQLRIRQRLERLREPAALEAVNGPLTLTSLAFAPGVAEQLVADLREVRVESGVGAERRAVNVLGEFVEPVQLQVVCQRLVRDLPPETKQITGEHLARFGSVDATLEDFYQDAVVQAASSSGVKPDDLARWGEEHLITATGTRAVVHRGPTHSEGMPNAAPDALVTGLLLRREPRAGAEWYELTHDRLIGPIQAARRERERREAEDRGYARAKRALRLAGQAVAAAALLLALVLVWAAVYFGQQSPACSGTLTCVWAFQTGKEVFGRPAVNGEMIYIPSVDGNVYAVDSAQAREMSLFGRQLPFVRDGASRQMLWTFSTADQVWSSPALGDGALFVGSQAKSLFAVDAATGASKWGFAANAAIVDSPAVADGRVFIGSFDNNLYALDEKSGAKLWSFLTGGPLVSSPTISEGTVYVGSNDFFVYAIDAATGGYIWRFKTGERVWSTPVIVDGVLYVGSHDHHLYALDAATGELIWQFATGERVRSSPTVIEGIVYFGSYDRNVYALDAATGRELWRFQTGNWVVASPLVHQGVVYIGSNDRNFYAIDAASGRELGRLTTGSAVQSFPAVLGNQILFGNGKGTVYAINQVASAGVPLPPLGIPATPVATPRG